MENERVIKVLHVLGGLNRGGVETWLMHVLRHIDPARIQIDFLVNSDVPGVYDDEVRALGARVLPCPNPGNLISYSRSFLQITQQFGPYDVIHSHVHHFSGWVLALARREGIQIRIAHSHSDTSSIDSKADAVRRSYLRISKELVNRFSTLQFAASSEAAKALFGTSWDEDARNHILYYGIDLRPFKVPIDRDSIRAEFGISSDALVVGHVGRFDAVKNHEFFVDIATEILAQQPNAIFLLVGTGSLRERIELRANEAGLNGQIIFAGSRSDVPRVMRGAMDVFLLPSFYEGLPVASIEAQAAGLPVVLSDTITREADILPERVRHLPLSSSAITWAEEVLAASRFTGNNDPTDAMRVFEGSPFDITRTVKDLAECYSTGKLPLN